MDGKELISMEERADGTEARWYLDEEGREIMEEIPAKGSGFMAATSDRRFEKSRSVAAGDPKGAHGADKEGRGADDLH